MHRFAEPLRTTLTVAIAVLLFHPLATAIGNPRLTALGALCAGMYQLFTMPVPMPLKKRAMLLFLPLGLSGLVTGVMLPENPVLSCLLVGIAVFTWFYIRRFDPVFIGPGIFAVAMFFCTGLMNLSASDLLPGALCMGVALPVSYTMKFLVFPETRHKTLHGVTRDFFLAVENLLRQVAPDASGKIIPGRLENAAVRFRKTMKALRPRMANLETISGEEDTVSATIMQSEFTIRQRIKVVYDSLKEIEAEPDTLATDSMASAGGFLRHTATMAGLMAGSPEDKDGLGRDSTLAAADAVEFRRELIGRNLEPSHCLFAIVRMFFALERICTEIGHIQKILNKETMTN